MSKTFEGKNINEVWDFRLSTAVPVILNSGETWIVQIHSKDNPDYDPNTPEAIAAPLEEYDTGIPCEVGDAQDPVKVAKCYEWLHSVRDKYARPDIEELKPLVKKVREAEAVLAAKLYAL